MIVAFNIAGRPIGPGNPCFIIAEAGVNRRSVMDLCMKVADPS